MKLPNFIIGGALTVFWFGICLIMGCCLTLASQADDQIEDLKGKETNAHN